MATRAYFGFPRVTGIFTLSGGSWNSSYPLSNLLTLEDGLLRVARSTNATTGSTVIIATGSATVSASVVALVGHNLSQGATIRVRTWTDTAGTTGLVDSGTVNVWASGYTAAELAGAVWTWFYRFADPGPATVGRAQLNITDTGNVSGYVQAGFLEIAQAADVAVQFDRGAQYGRDWRSQVAESIGGTEYVNVRDHPRIFKANFSRSARSESQGKFYEMVRQLRADQPILVVPLPTETTHLLRTVMFARLMDPGLAQMRVASNLGILDSVPLAFREIIG